MLPPHMGVGIAFMARPLECRPPQAGCRPRYCCRCRAGLRCLHDAMPPSELELSPRTPLRSLLGGIGRRQSFEVPQLHGYRVGRTLGKGKFGKVRTAVDKETGEVVAIKHITKPQGKAELAAMAREVQLMRSVDHPRLVKLHKVVDTERVLYLVLEQLHGGEVCPPLHSRLQHCVCIPCCQPCASQVFDRVVKRGPYPERRAALVTSRLLDALLYLHAKGIAHRDLKPENILLASDDDDAQVKLIDFGLSRSFAAAPQGGAPSWRRHLLATARHPSPLVGRAVSPGYWLCCALGTSYPSAQGSPGQGRAGQGSAGQGSAGQGRAQWEAAVRPCAVPWPGPWPIGRGHRCCGVQHPGGGRGGVHTDGHALAQRDRRVCPRGPAYT